MAPSARVSSPLTRRRASKNCLTPRPSQPLQAPAGLLKENSRGSSSLIEWPHWGQAKRERKVISSSSSPSMGAMMAMPSARCRAVPKDSARRRCRYSRTWKRSNTTSLARLLFLCNAVDAAVDAGADKALGAQLVEQGQMLALALAHHRCQQHQLAALGQRQHLVDHLADGLCRQGQVMIRAARLPGAGKQQAQVIVDLG